MSDQSTEKKTNEKTVVFVHGAFADGSCWNKVIPTLLAKGLNVISVQNPLNSLADDVAAAKRAIAVAAGEVILVGHSYGGAIITQGGNEDKVSALVYVAAFAPSLGETANETQKDYPPPVWASGINVDSEGYATLTADTMTNYFAHDLSADETTLMTITQGPTALSCLDTKMTETAWANKPSWFIVATEDFMINPDSERKFAEKMGAKTTVLTTSHVPMLSKPDEVAAVILDAAGLTEKSESSAGSM